jgi:hypothetical protein
MFGISNLQSPVMGSIDRTDTRMSQVGKMLSTGKNDLNAAQTGMVTRLNASIAGFDAAQDNITNLYTFLTLLSKHVTSKN